MHDRTRTYEPFPTGDANERATNWALLLGGTTTAVIGFIVGVVDGDAATAVLSASVGGLASGTLIRSRMAPPARTRRAAQRSRQAPFAGTESLINAKLKLSMSRATHARALKDKLDLRRRLVGLSTKMEEVALPAYVPRIASIAAALATLDKQMAVITRLRDGYDKSLTMIEIELESGAAVSDMSDDAGASIAASMCELQALEESQAELARQLEANVEVEQLLRPRRAAV